MAYPDANSRPGTRAAKKSFPTETSAYAPIVTSMMEGGIRIPREPPAHTIPAESRWSYPHLSRIGMESIPIVTTDAPTMPVVAAKMVETTITAKPRPPFRGPNR